MFTELCINISQTYSYKYTYKVAVSIDFNTEVRQQDVHTAIFYTLFTSASYC